MAYVIIVSSHILKRESIHFKNYLYYNAVSVCSLSKENYCICQVITGLKYLSPHDLVVYKPHAQNYTFLTIAHRGQLKHILYNSVKKSSIRLTM